MNRPIRVGVAACLAVIGLMGLLAFAHCAVRSPLERLANAAEKDSSRAVEGRISGFDFRPMASRGGATARPAFSHARVEALRIVKLLRNGVDAEVMHALGVAHLLLDEPRVAEELLERAVSGGAGARAWSDLAAARIALGRAENDAHAFAEALAAADRALALDPISNEALFNRAVALGALELRDGLVQAVRRYRLTNTASGWSNDLSQRVSRVETRESWRDKLQELRASARTGDTVAIETVAASYPEDARTWGEVEFLGEWGARYLAGETCAADDALRLSKSLGAAVARRSSEAMLSDAVATIGAASSPTGLAEGHETFRRARRLYADRKNAESVPLFERAAVLLQRGGSPMWLKARRFQANALHDLGRSDEASVMIANLRSVSPPSYQALHAELLWQQGTIEATQGHLAESIESYRQASLRFEHLGETSNAATVRQMLAARLQAVGARTEAWQSLVAAFSAMSTQAGDDLQRALTGAARGEVAEEHWDVARSFIDVAIGLRLSNRNARREAFMWTQRAIASSHVRAGDVASDLVRARAAALRISDKAAREAAAFDIRFVDAAIVSAGSPRRAEELLTTNIEWAQRNAYLTRLPEQFLERSRARVALGYPGEARTDLLTAFEMIETRGQNVDSFGRATLLSAVDRAVDEVVGSLVNEGSATAALDLIEAAAESVARVRHTTARASTVAGVPAGAFYIRYHVLPNQTLIFTVKDGAVALHRVRQRRAALRTHISTLVTAIHRSDDALAAQILTRLHDALIAPLDLGSASPEQLIFAPDALLANIPFGALRNRKTGRAIIEDFRHSYTRSVSSLTVQATGEVARLHALVVSNPGSSCGEGFQSPLPALPAAETEGRKIAASLGAKSTTGCAATPRYVREVLPRVAVFHFAGHAVQNIVDGRYSYLVLAADGRSGGALYLREIESLDLRSVETVVLAACRTSVAAPERRHPLSLSSAFLSAGAKSVIGTLWDVDDEAAQRFSVRFHQRVVAGRRPSDAARDAQLEMFRSSPSALGSLRSWAPFQVWIG
jgi:CHAT domain-containing protein